MSKVLNGVSMACVDRPIR